MGLIDQRAFKSAPHYPRSAAHSRARMRRIGDAANDPAHNSASGAEGLKKKTGHVRPTYH
jgi:hypothetical protein